MSGVILGLDSTRLCVSGGVTWFTSHLIPDPGARETRIDLPSRSPSARIEGRPRLCASAKQCKSPVRTLSNKRGDPGQISNHKNELDSGGLIEARGVPGRTVSCKTRLYRSPNLGSVSMLHRPGYDTSHRKRCRESAPEQKRAYQKRGQVIVLFRRQREIVDKWSRHWSRSHHRLAAGRRTTS